MITRTLQPAQDNPFVIGHHAEGAAFADRVDEVARLTASMRDPSTRLVLYGDRRLGKSSAILVAAEAARAAGTPVAIVDLGKASSATAAGQRVLSAVHREIGVPIDELLSQAAARLRGAVSVNVTAEPGGTTSFGLRLEPGAPAEAQARLVTDVLDVVEERCAKRGQRIAIVLDEFQRLLLWGTATPDDVEWALKATFETHRHIAYVMAGSSRSLVSEMISQKRRALWGVVEAVEMRPIDAPLLVGWIRERASATGVAIDAVAAAAIVRLAGPRTRDVVQLARATWFRARSQASATREDAIAAFESVVDEQAALHLRLWESRTVTERKVLIALAAGAVPLAAESLATFDLGPKSTAQSALRALVSDEILAEGYGYDDPYFRRWVERNALEDVGRRAPELIPL